MEFETLRFDIVWRFDMFNKISYNNSILNISASIFSILVFRYRFRIPFGGNQIANSGKFFDIGFSLVRY